jgi:hypothetical protein
VQAALTRAAVTTEGGRNREGRVFLGEVGRGTAHAAAMAAADIPDVPRGSRDRGLEVLGDPGRGIVQAAARTAGSMEEGRGRALGFAGGLSSGGLRRELPRAGILLWLLLAAASLLMNVLGTAPPVLGPSEAELFLVSEGSFDVPLGLGLVGGLSPDLRNREAAGELGAVARAAGFLAGEGDAMPGDGGNGTAHAA